MIGSLATDIQKVLAYQGYAAAEAAAAGSTDPDVLALLAHYKAAGCSPSNLAPMPSSILASQPGAYWLYEPSGRDQCAFSSWNPAAGTPPPPIPTPAQNIVAAAPATLPPPVPIAPGQAVVSSTPGVFAWLTEPSTILPTVPKYWLLGGAALLGLLLFSRRR